MIDAFDDDYGELSDPVGPTVFRDVIMIALAGFLVVVLLLLPWLNPEGREGETTLTPPGSVIVELLWPEESHSDIDLWVQAPQGEPVGFSNKGGVYYNLLRDDLGKLRDVTPINYETTYSRGIPGGEQVVNVHLYRLAAREGPIPVSVVVSVVTPKERGRQHLVTARALLEREGQEITVARFSIDSQGRLRGPVHDLPRSLVNPGKRLGYRRQAGRS